MLDVEIQPNVPIPKASWSGEFKVYPFVKMNVGDSFELPVEKKDSLRSSANLYVKRYGVKFKTRVIVKGKTSIIRIWRIK